MQSEARWLDRLATFLIGHARLVLVVGAAIAVVAAAVAVRLEVNTSRTNLGHATMPSEQAFGDFLREFGSPNDLIAVVDSPGGAGEETLRATADDLAATLARDTANVRSTYHRVEIDHFMRHLLLYVPEPELQQIRNVLESDFVSAVRAGRTGGLDAMLRELASVITTRASADVDAARAAQGLDAMTRIAREVEARLKDPERTGLVGFRELAPPLKEGALDDAGYLQSRDGRLRVVFVRPVIRSDANEVVMPLVRTLRDTASRVAAAHPGTRIRLTGLPALQADEQVLVEHDMRVTTLISLAVVAMVLIYGYRRPRQVALSLLSLGAAVLVTLAWVRLQFHQVNLVASMFAPILLGRGSDFDVYLISRYNAARALGLGPADAVRRTLTASGGMVTGAVLTSLAFLVAAMGQSGVFHQMGIVVGVGLLLVLLASLFITPALLFLYGDSRLSIEKSAEALLDRIPPFGVGPGAIALRRPGTVLGVAAVALMALAFYARNPQFDFDLMKLMPSTTESVSAQNDLSRNSDYGTDVVVVTTSGVEEARALAARLEARPTVNRVESIASLIPLDQDRKLPRIEAMRQVALSIPPMARPSPPTTSASVAAALEALSEAVEDKEFAAHTANHPAAPALARLARAVESLSSTFRGLPPAEAQRRMEHMEEQLFGLLGKARDVLRMNYQDQGGLKPLTLDRLPLATRERFLGEGGRTALYVFPKIPGAGPQLDAFVADVRAVAPQATGFPVIYHDSSRSTLRGLIRASSLALLVVALSVFLHFRELRATLITLIPMVVAALATPALMKWAGIANNMANIVALPLLVGMSADYGLQLVHHARRFPGESLRVALRETGLGVFLAGGTTAAGFGAIMLGQHAGGRSLGGELLLGTLAALVGALVVLPAVLAVERRSNRSDGAAP